MNVAVVEKDDAVLNKDAAVKASVKVARVEERKHYSQLKGKEKKTKNNPKRNH